MAEILTAQYNVLLRELDGSAAEVYFAAYNRSRLEIAVFDEAAHTKHVTVEQTRATLEDGQKLRYGIYDRDTFTGSINLSDEGAETGVLAEIGYWLDSGHTGMGYATLAASALAAHARNALGFQEVVANVDRENVASAAVLQRAGFVLSGSDETLDFYRYEGTEIV